MNDDCPGLCITRESWRRAWDPVLLWVAIGAWAFIIFAVVYVLVIE